ncbi:putative sugar transporter [Tricladium varicosporioides]|nr:putative sugar transporter [Hymenoscyphus varicosporioides]
MEQALASPSRKKGWSNGGLIVLNLILTIAQISSYATGYDGSMMNGLQSLDTWQAYFNTPSPGTLGLLNAIQNIGQLAALPFCAVACDMFGRVAVLEFGAFIILIGTALQGAAQNTGMFIAARGIIGLGLAFNITAAPLLLLELAYPTQRAPQVSIYNALWNSGAIVAAWTTYGTFRITNDWAWRIPSIIQGLASIIQIGSCWFLVESPRWLMSKGRDEKARKVITKYHANNNPDDPLVNLELEEIRRALEFEMEMSRSTSYMAFFKTKGNRHRFFIILAVGFFSQWSGNGLTSYYLTLVMDSIGYKSQDTQTLVNGLLQIWGLVTSLFFALLVNKFGRRTLFLASTVAILAVFIVWTALEATYEQETALSGEGSPAVAKGVLAMIFLYSLAFNIGWNPLQVTYVIEILPYHLRAKGLVLYNLFVACALIFNQYANPIGVTNIGWKYYVVYDVWIAVELVIVYFLFIETGNMSLEQTAAILDGTQVQDKLVEEVARAVDENHNREITEIAAVVDKKE